MSSLMIGLIMLGGIAAVIVFIFYKASPLPKRLDLRGDEHWTNGTG